MIAQLLAFLLTLVGLFGLPLLAICTAIGER